jgi:nucleotidyltransferase/DNA polymerase involved in DNA repair
MSILCCYTPNFLFIAAALAHPEWHTLPVALLGPDERVWCASTPAQACGVHAGLTARQARARCPDAHLPSLDLTTCEAHQSAFLDVLAQTGLSVEVQDYGAAYVDLSPVTTSPLDAAPVCAALGKQVRNALGEALQPAVGCDSGKFTARAASCVARAGRMRVVDKADETRFLGPLPVTTLPLPAQTLHYLRWLGLNTLAQFGALKTGAVAERFGKDGALAHRWARGLDDRPVRPTVKNGAEPIELELESPTASHVVALDLAMRALEPRLRRMSRALEGFRKLHVALSFLDGTRRLVTVPFVTPLSDPPQVRTALTQALKTYTWNAELVRLSVTLMDLAELQPVQLTLFNFDDVAFGITPTAKPPPGGGKPIAPFVRLVEALRLRHAGALFQAEVTDAQHAVRERRFQWTPLQQ